MVILKIDNNTYRAFESWSEITVKKARELFKLANTAPENLLSIYIEEAKGKEADLKQINLWYEELEADRKELDKFFRKVFACLTNVPKGVVKKTNKNDIQTIYSHFLMPFVFGVLHFPIKETKSLKKFNWCGIDYHSPEFKKIMGTKRYFHKETADVFCDASDLDSQGRKHSEYGKYTHAEHIIAILFREKGQDYLESESLRVADEYFRDTITCDIFHAALQHLANVNETLETLFPNMYQSSGDMASHHASNASGLNSFGWLTSIMTIAKMQLLNKPDMTPLQSVQKTLLYDFMTVLSNTRADNDFRKIYSDTVNKKRK